MVLQAVVVLTALLELMSIASIAPFMALVAAPESIHNSALAKQLLSILGEDMQAARLGIVILGLLVISTTLSLITSWQLSRFGARLGADFSIRLYEYYVNQDWIFHTNTNSATLTNNISHEAYRVTQGIIQPSLIILSKFTLTFFLIAGVFLLEPIIAVIGASFFSICYLIIFQISKLSLTNSGQKVSEHSEKRLRVITEGFGAIKDTLILHKQAAFSEAFKDHSLKWADHLSNIRVLGQAPRFIMEGVTFGSVIGFIILMSLDSSNNLAELLPKLTVFALAGLKILPAMQAIFSNLSSIKSNAPAFDNIAEDLQKHQAFQVQSSASSKKAVPIIFDGDIQLNHVSYTYSGSNQKALDNISLNIPKNATVGFAGPSGSGKSTLIDVISGLTQCTSGSMEVGSSKFQSDHKVNWGDKIGYVPQSIFLLDSTIRENIAFGISPTDICPQKLKSAIEKAHLTELIGSLKSGLETIVGERGVQLSGGQRQRIGIARALYYDPDLLIFDEATSALDGISENKIMEAISGLHGTKTIIMIAHRLSTLKACDTIFFIENGGISHQGNFDELVTKSDVFRKMSG